MSYPPPPPIRLKVKRAVVRVALQVEELDDRVVPSAIDLALLAHDPHTPQPEALPALSMSSGGTSSLAAAALPSSANYSSLPGAPANIYLDFGGDTEVQWGSYSNITTPAYDTDGDPSTFSSTELNNIYLIWQQVAEAYSPFNVNVTTVAPASLAHGVTQKVVVGGNGSWSGGTYGGLTYTGGFANSSLPNVSFVFSANLSNGNAWDTAVASAHEAGHGFGLYHQSQWSGTTLANEYYAGPGDGTAPIMGYGYSASRAMWWYGTSDVSSTTCQNDMAVIASATNGFGYRPEATGSTPGTAAPLSVSGSGVSAAGVIESHADLNDWAFTTDAGTITLTVSVPAFHNLSAKAELLDAQGNVVVTWQGPNSTGGTSITATVTGGAYYLVVASTGPSAGSTSTNYGFAVGQYTVSGTIVPPVNFVAAPTGLSATAVSPSQVNLSWTNNAGNATGVTVQRSTDGVNWATLATLAATATSYADTGLAAGTTYSYRVQAFNGTATSAYSNTATAATPGLVPAAPSNLTAGVRAGKKVLLTWKDNSTNETGFVVQTSTDGVNWTALVTLAANTTSYTTNLPRSGVLYFRVLATSAAGTSAPSNVVSVTSGGVVSGAKPAAEAVPSDLARALIVWSGPAQDPFRGGFRFWVSR